MATNKSKEPVVDPKQDEKKPVQESPKEQKDSKKKFIPLPDKEVNVAVSSRALFDLEEENKVYEEKGRNKYVELHFSREDTILKPGSAFPFIKALECVNAKLKEENPDEKELFAITLMSHNSGQVAIRLQKAIKHHGLNVPRIALTSGSNVVPYLKTFEITLFLTTCKDEVAEALTEGIAAAMMSLQPMNSPSEIQLRIVFDLDVVLFADKNKESDETVQHEDIPLSEGSLKGFAEVIGRMQKKLANVDPCPIRTFVVSSRDAIMGNRALITLRHWGLEIDEIYFTNGLPTDGLLGNINPHIYFNNKDADVECARAKGTPTGHVIKHGDHYDDKKREKATKELFPSDKH